MCQDGLMYVSVVNVSYICFRHGYSQCTSQWTDTAYQYRASTGSTRYVHHQAQPNVYVELPNL